MKQNKNETLKIPKEFLVLLDKVGSMMLSDDPEIRMLGYRSLISNQYYKKCHPNSLVKGHGFMTLEEDVRDLKKLLYSFRNVLHLSRDQKISVENYFMYVKEYFTEGTLYRSHIDPVIVKREE